MRLLPLTLCLAFAAPVMALAADDEHAPVPGDASVTLDNHWSSPLDLYVDRSFGCSAPKDGTCTVTLDAGEHELQARSGEEVVAREFVTVKTGENFSYRVEKGKSPNL